MIGTPYYGIFWFQFNLIFLSLFFSIISFAFKDKLLPIIQFFGVISLYFQVSKINYNLFFYNGNNIINKNIRKNLASLIELMPILSIGCSLSSVNIIVYLQKMPRYYCLILLFLIILLFNYNIFISLKGFRYPNIFLNSFASTILLLLFGSLFDNSNKKIKVLIFHITQFTGGIYCLHPIIRDYLSNNFVYFIKKNRTYFTALNIYIISYSICFIGYKLFHKYNLKYPIF